MSRGVRYLVHFALFYTCIEGLVVNILYPNVLAFIYKDLVLLAVYVAIFGADPNRLFTPPSLMRKFYAPLVLFAFAVVFFMLVPSGNFLVSAVAVKQRLFYIPMALIGYMFVRTERDLLDCLTLLTIYAVGVSAFGIYLYFTGPSGLSAIGANYSAVVMAARTTVDVWRVPGTFNSPGAYGAYLLFSATIACGLVLADGVGRRDKIVAAVSLVACVLAIFASGSRSPFVLVTATAGTLLLLSGRLTKMGFYAVTAYVAGAYAFVVLGVGVQERFESILSAEHIERFKGTWFGQMFISELLANPLGQGLGYVTVGARHFAEVGATSFVETYLGLLAIEMGWPGLLPFLWASVAIFLVVLRAWREMVHSPLKQIWNAMAIFVLVTILLLPVSTGLDSPPTNIYFWFSLGVLVRLIDLERYRLWMLRTRMAQAWAASQQPRPAAAAGAAATLRAR